jgi:hypothetical protein
MPGRSQQEHFMRIQIPDEQVFANAIQTTWFSKAASNTLHSN